MWSHPGEAQQTTAPNNQRLGAHIGLQLEKAVLIAPQREGITR